MQHDNETVSDIRAEVGEYLTSIGPSELPDETEVEEFADRFVAAHNREIAAKDAEIARLKACRDGDCERIRLSAEPCEGCHVQIAQDEMARLRTLVGELADALLAACDDTCDYCKKHLNIGEASALICLHNRQCNVGQAYGRLVAKAREVCK